MSYNCWIVHFKDGKKSTMLSHDCESKEEAEKASIERFGKRFSFVEKSNFNKAVKNG